MIKEELGKIKQGYQPIHSKNASVIPPNTGSHVRMKENGYTWKDLDKAWWEGFNNAKNKMEKRIAELEKENANLKALRKYELNVSKLEIEKLEKENKWLKLGYNIKNCKGKTCINCDNYNEIGWFDENNIPQVSCRLGGYHYGLDACEDFKQVDK